MRASATWLEHGAISHVECVADGVKPGKVTSFPRSVKLKTDELVVFSYATDKSRADRNRVMRKVMSDPRLQMDAKSMPFDAKRMLWGGFEAIVEL